MNVEEIINEYFADWTYPNIDVERKFKDVFRDAYEMGLKETPKAEPDCEHCGHPADRHSPAYYLCNDCDCDSFEK